LQRIVLENLIPYYIAKILGNRLRTVNPFPKTEGGFPAIFKLFSFFDRIEYTLFVPTGVKAETAYCFALSTRINFCQNQKIVSYGSTSIDLCLIY
jgi:hypothetical protein